MLYLQHIMRSPSITKETDCAAGTLRRAARSLTRVYDAHLAHAGLTTAQFSILRTLERGGGSVPLAQLADQLIFERTSLYRALVPLRRAALVVTHAGADRRAKDVALTRLGRRRIGAAMRHWIAAQRSVVGRFGAREWPRFAARVGHLTAIARSETGG
jgi:DNA-binding MarR family transcriptional regulator